MSIYEELGYNNRKDYLLSVAIDHNVPFTMVKEIASMLGECEDFDELINFVERL